MNEQLATFFERLAEKERSQQLLRRMGLDPRQFVLFLGLFRTLSERGEFAGAIGVNRFNIAYMALYAAALLFIVWLALAVFLPARIFLFVNLSSVFVLTFLVIIREAANSLFNPVEASILAHNPVHSITYAAAKIAHIIIAVLYLVSGLAVWPALAAGMVNEGTRWFWPFTHLAAAFLIGLWTAFLICALYGLLRRVVPANFLKGTSTLIQLLSLIAIIAVPIFHPGSLFRILLQGFQSGQSTWLPLTWFVEVGQMGCRNASWRLEWQGSLSIAATIVIIWLGLRSFSFAYFSETSSMVEGGTWRNREKTIFGRCFSAIVRALTGSPTGLGAFHFISKMMRRDWQFRRLIFTQTWFLFVIILAIILIAARSGTLPSPLSESESPANILPHLLGLMATALCINISFTEFHNGPWIFLTAPIGQLRAFARGIYWALWTPAVGLPHLIMLPFLIHFWDWKEVTLFTCFSLAVVSLYVGIGIAMISGLPFSSRLDETRTIVSATYIQVCWFAAIIFPTLFQAMLFQHWLVALLSGITLLVLAWLVVHWNLGGLEQEMRWRLHTMKMGSNRMFQVIQ